MMRGHLSRYPGHLVALGSDVFLWGKPGKHRSIILNMCSELIIMMYPRFIRIRHHYDPKIIENSRAGLFQARALELVRESVGFRRKRGETGQR